MVTIESRIDERLGRNKGRIAGVSNRGGTLAEYVSDTRKQLINRAARQGRHKSKVRPSTLLLGKEGADNNYETAI